MNIETILLSIRRLKMVLMATTFESFLHETKLRIFVEHFVKQFNDSVD